MSVTICVADACLASPVVDFSQTAVAAIKSALFSVRFILANAIANDFWDFTGAREQIIIYIFFIEIAKPQAQHMLTHQYL